MSRQEPNPIRYPGNPACNLADSSRCPESLLHAERSYISWHKATRSVWVNFGNGDIANRAAQIPGILVRSFRGLNAADTMKPGELNGDSESKAAEGGELDELPQQELKWRLEFEKALDALSERDWQGHLVAVCIMRGKPRNLDTTPAGSDIAEECDIPEKHEATEEHKTEGGLEFPD